MSSTKPEKTEKSEKAKGAAGKAALRQLEKTLKLDIKKAMGCTEPLTIALAVCKARRELSKEAKIKQITLKVSTNLLKNALEVGIPGSGGQRGIPLAAALGCLAEKPTPDLDILENINEQWLKNAQKLVEGNVIKIELCTKQYGLYIDAKVVDADKHFGRCVIKGSHENCVLLENNNGIVLSKKDDEEAALDSVLLERRALASTSFSDIFNNISGLSQNIRALVKDGISMNMKVAKAGLGKDGFLNIGNVYRNLISEGWIGGDVINEAKVLTAAAVDARMSGCSLPVMTSAGSGNQGLTISLPLYVLANHLKVGDNKLTEALALAHGITSILKYHSGTLSAMCGCVVCSGIGLTVGASYLLGGGIEAATAAVNNMVGGVTGIICDGAKVGCSIKLICAIDSAFQAAMMAMHGLNLPTTNGVLGETIESSLANIGLIAAPGMIETDDQILSIMLGKPARRA